MTVEVLMAIGLLVTLILGAFGGAGIAALFLERRWRSDRNDLVNRIHAPTPGDYLALRQGVAAAEEMERRAEGKTKEPFKEVTEDRQPWKRDPAMEGIEVEIDERNGVAYLIEGEDSDEEDLHVFLARYGMTTEQYLNEPILG